MKKILLFLTINILSFSLSAQSMHLKKIDVFGGNQNLKINDLSISKKGYLYFATKSGLYHFDGRSSNLIDTRAETNNTSIVRCINDTIFFSNKSNQLFKIQNNESVEILLSQELKKKVSDIISTSLGTMISTKGNGILILSANGSYSLDSLVELPDKFIYDMEYYKDDLYLATDEGILILNLKDFSLQQFTTEEGLPDNICKVIKLKDKKLYIGTGFGLAVFNIETSKIYTNNELNCGNVKQLNVCNDNVYASTSKEVFFLDNTNKINKIDFDIDIKIKHSLSDNQGNVWIVATDGVYIAANSGYNFIYNPDKTNNVSAIDVNKDNLWFKSDQGLFIHNNRAFQSIISEELENTYITCIEHLNDSIILLGTLQQGIFKYNNSSKTFSRINDSDGITSNSIFDLSIIENNILVISTLGGGVNTFNLKTNQLSKVIDIKSGLNSNYVYSTYQDKNNDLWIAKDGGYISKLSDNNIVTYDSTKGIMEATNFSIKGNSKQFYVLGKNGNVYQFDSKQDRFFSLSDSLEINNTPIISMDCNDNYLYLVSNQNHYILNLINGNFKSHGINEEIAFLTPHQNAIEIENDKVYIGVKDKIIRYDLNYKTNYYPTPFLRTVKVFDHVMTGVFSKSFKHDENEFTFNYDAIWYKSPNDIRFRYKLTGYENNWSPETVSRFASYSKLPPGDYSFHIAVSLGDGEWYQLKDNISFSIAKPYWQEWWFYLLIVALVAVSIVLFIKWRMYKLQQDKEVLESEVIRRTKEIEKQRKIVEEKNKQITDSIKYASRIQQNMLPDTNNLSKNFAENFFLFLPRDIVSGDFYWHHENEHYHYIAGVDCTGHGVPGALMSMIGTASLNAIVNTNPTIKPNEILDALHTKIVRALNQDSDDIDSSNDGMDLSILAYSKTDNKILIASAKRPVFYIVNNELHQIKGDKFPIGGSQYNQFRKEYTLQTLDIDSPTSVYLTSDGYADQFGGSSNKKFMVKKLKSLLIDHHEKPLKQQKQILNEAFQQWMEDTIQTDDVLVIGLHFDKK